MFSCWSLFSSSINKKSTEEAFRLYLWCSEINKFDILLDLVMICRRCSVRVFFSLHFDTRYISFSEDVCTNYSSVYIQYICKKNYFIPVMNNLVIWWTIGEYLSYVSMTTWLPTSFPPWHKWQTILMIMTTIYHASVNRHLRSRLLCALDHTFVDFVLH